MIYISRLKCKKTIYKDFKYLSLLKHYGFPTRLLDITSDENIALYFACNNNFIKDGIVYIFNNEKKLQEIKTNNAKLISEKNSLIKNYNAYINKNINEIFPDVKLESKCK